MHHQIVQVSLLYFTDCPSWREASRRLRHALDHLGHPETPVTLIAVESDADATTLGLRGSPTITIDGQDLFPHPLPPVGLTCRIYPTPNGLAGIPDLVNLITALRERAHR